MEVKELKIKGLGHSLLSFNCSWLLCSILWNNPPGEQPSSCKRLCIQTSEKTIFMQTNNINNNLKKIPRISFLSVLCKKSVNTYRQSHTDLFLIFKIILTPMSPKPVCVLGRSQHSLLLSTNRAIYHLQSLGRPLSFSNHFLIKTVILIFHSWAILVQWEAQCVSLCTSGSPVVVMLSSWEVRWLNSKFDI